MVIGPILLSLVVIVGATSFFGIIKVPLLQQFLQQQNFQEHQKVIVDHDKLIEYALMKINQDRETFNSMPVQLSYNHAAQVQAEDILKARHLSHWMTNGYKPYMTYTLYGGKGYVGQNAAYSPGYSDTALSECRNGTVICQSVDPFKEIGKLEWAMMYNDTQCCHDGHRQNILDRYHTAASIGMAYDGNSLAMVENFENNYIQFNKPLISDKEHVEISGQLISKNATLDSISIYYDQTPSSVVYQQNKNRTFYDPGKFIAAVVKPLDRFHYYIQPSNYTLIQAMEWLDDSQLIDVVFDPSSILTNEGIYTIYVHLKETNTNNIHGDTFPVTSYSIFYRGNVN